MVAKTKSSLTPSRQSFHLFSGPRHVYVITYYSSCREKFAFADILFHWTSDEPLTSRPYCVPRHRLRFEIRVLMSGILEADVSIVHSLKTMHEKILRKKLSSSRTTRTIGIVWAPLCANPLQIIPTDSHPFVRSEISRMVDRLSGVKSQKAFTASPRVDMYCNQRLTRRVTTSCIIPLTRCGQNHRQHGRTTRSKRHTDSSPGCETIS